MKTFTKHVLTVITLFNAIGAQGADEKAFITHSPKGDFLYAGNQKIMLKKDGILAALNISPYLDKTDKVDEKRTQTISGGLSGFEPSGEVVAWVCLPTGIITLGTPQTQSLKDVARFSGALELFGNLSSSTLQETKFSRVSRVSILGCSVSDKGKLLVAYTLHFKKSSAITSNESPRFESVATYLEIVETTRLSSDSRDNTGNMRSTFLQPRLKTLIDPSLSFSKLRTGYSNDTWAAYFPEEKLLQTFNQNLDHLTDFDLPELENVVIRSGFIMGTFDGTPWLGHLNFQSETRTISKINLTLSPCDEDLSCAVSIASDGSWILSGYWGTYLGKKGLFRRLNLRNFSAENQPLVLSHSGAPGVYSVFGADDSDIGRIQESAPEAIFKDRSNVTQSDGPKSLRLAAAWLKETALVLPGEEVLFRVSGKRLITTPYPFDPLRQIAFEKAQIVETRLPQILLPIQNLEISETENFWYADSLGFAQSENFLKERGVQPKPVTLALLDSGADFNNPFFSPHSPQGNKGYDFVDEDDDPTDQFGHGTHVSGLAKPIFTGFSWLFENISLLIVRVLDEKGLSNTISIGRGFIYAAENKAEIINASWGGGAPTQFMEDAINFAHSKGALIVTSAGNDRLNIDKLDQAPVPGNFQGVISIGASNERGKRAPYSNYGEQSVFGFLPGDRIASLALGGSFMEKSGTSMAAPLFAALMATARGVQIAQETKTTEWRTQLLEAFCQAADKRDRSLESRCRRLQLFPVIQQISSTDDQNL